MKLKPVYRVEIAFGHTDSNGIALPGDEIARAEALALRSFALRFRGAQMERHQGAYLSSDGRVIVEPSTTVWAYDSGGEPAVAPMSDLADEIAALLHQESVLLTVTEQQGQMLWVHPEPQGVGDR